MISLLFTVGISAASIYCFYAHNYLLAVGLLLWSASRLFDSKSKALARAFALSEWQTNSIHKLQFAINMEKVLGHSSVHELFQKLKMQNVVKDKNSDIWILHLLEIFKKKHKVDSPWYSVEFTIRGNLVSKNGSADAINTVYDEVFIPYHEQKENGLIENTEHGINIRIFIVNGFIKLQLGRFTKEHSPNVYKPGHMAVYQSYETITLFPLLYATSHRLPVKYLNLSHHATESYKRSQYGDKTKETWSDWKELSGEVREYIEIHENPDGDADGRWLKLIKKFNEKERQWLEKEAFKPLYEHSEGINHHNDYLTVAVYDNSGSGLNSGFKEYLSDYYKEEP